MYSDEELVKRTLERYRDAKDHSKPWRESAIQCYDFVAHRQYSQPEMDYLADKDRPVITFNRIGPVVDAVCGHQVSNRQETRFFPRQPGDVQVNEILTGASQWVDDECDAEDEISDSFFDLVVTGMGWSEIRISYDEEPDGKVHSAERIPPLEMYWDHRAKKRNLADARYKMRGQWMARSDAEAKWPKLKEIQATENSIWAEEDEIEEPHNATEASLYKHDAKQWYDDTNDRVFVLQHQYWELEPIYRVATGGRMIELTENKFNKLKEHIETQGLRYVRQVKKKYYQGFIIGPEVMEHKEAPCPTAFTLRAITGKRDVMKNLWYGLVIGMLDPQRWSNKMFSDINEMMTRNRGGGAYVEESALVDPRKAEEQWSTMDPLILVKDGSLAKGAIKERQQVAYPAGLDRLLQFAVQSIPDVSGINMEMMGLVNRDQPGILESQRKKAALTILATIFDSMRRFMKERGRVVLYFITEYLNDGRLVRITGGDGMERYVPLALDPEVQRYDLIVDQSPTSPSQKEEVYGILAQIVPWLLQAGIPVPPEVLDYMPIPSSLAAKWKEQLQPDPNSPQSQLKQRAQQLEMEEKEAETDKDRSTAELNRAKKRDLEQRRKIELISQ
jgi:hypothetical protein